MTNNNFKILSIDGGGLRGIIPVRILQKLEQLTGKKVHEMFDMISGTSTGGLIASFLTLRDKENPEKPMYGLDTLEKIYSQQGSVIFPLPGNKVSEWLRDLKSFFRPKFSDEGINKVLRQYLGNYTSPPRLADSLLPILVSTYNLKINEPVFFKTSEANGDASANALIFDICRATSAAPTYLPAYSFTYKNQLATCIDGGVYVNNPSMASIAELKKYGKKGFYKKRDGSLVENLSEVTVLSLGTGSYTGDITEQQAEHWGALAWVTHIIDIMMKGVNQSIDYESHEMLNQANYLRVNVTIPDPKYDEMDDARNETIEYLKGQTEQQITSNDKLMTQILNLIN